MLKPVASIERLGASRGALRRRLHYASDIEASVVMALLDSHGIESFRVIGQHAGDLADGGERARADPHGGGRAAGRGGAAHHRAATARTSARAWCGCATSSTNCRRRIDYRFRDRGLLEHALTHKSRAAEDASGGVADNESLEFLGDAVLGLVVADALFRQYPTYDEGQKSKIKAAVVSTQSLARHAEQIRLGDHLILGRGEEKTGGRFKQALLADAYEALIAAIYLDGGLEAAEAFLRRELKEAIDAGSAPDVCARTTSRRCRSGCRRWAGRCPNTACRGEAGPIIARLFSVEVVVGGEVLGAATGRAKKEAEQEAARRRWPPATPSSAQRNE